MGSGDDKKNSDQFPPLETAILSEESSSYRYQLASSGKSISGSSSHSKKSFSSYLSREFKNIYKGWRNSSSAAPSIYNSSIYSRSDERLHSSSGSITSSMGPRLIANVVGSEHDADLESLTSRSSFEQRKADFLSSASPSGNSTVAPLVPRGKNQSSIFLFNKKQRVNSELSNSSSEPLTPISFDGESTQTSNRTSYTSVSLVSEKNFQLSPTKVSTPNFPENIGNQHEERREEILHFSEELARRSLEYRYHLASSGSSIDGRSVDGRSFSSTNSNNSVWSYFSKHLKLKRWKSDSSSRISRDYKKSEYARSNEPLRSSSESIVSTESGKSVADTILSVNASIDSGWEKHLKNDPSLEQGINELLNSLQDPSPVPAPLNPLKPSLVPLPLNPLSQIEYPNSEFSQKGRINSDLSNSSGESYAANSSVGDLSGPPSSRSSFTLPSPIAENDLTFDSTNLLGVQKQVSKTPDIEGSLNNLSGSSNGSSLELSAITPAFTHSSHLLEAGIPASPSHFQIDTASPVLPSSRVQEGEDNEDWNAIDDEIDRLEKDYEAQQAALDKKTRQLAEDKEEWSATLAKTRSRAKRENVLETLSMIDQLQTLYKEDQWHLDLNKKELHFRKARHESTKQIAKSDARFKYEMALLDAEQKKLEKKSQQREQEERKIEEYVKEKAPQFAKWFAKPTPDDPIPEVVRLKTFIDSPGFDANSKLTQVYFWQAVEAISKKEKDKAIKTYDDLDKLSEKYEISTEKEKLINEEKGLIARTIDQFDLVQELAVAKYIGDPKFDGMDEIKIMDCPAGMKVQTELDREGILQKVIFAMREDKNQDKSSIQAESMASQLSYLDKSLAFLQEYELKEVKRQLNIIEGLRFKKQKLSITYPEKKSYRLERTKAKRFSKNRPPSVKLSDATPSTPLPIVSKLDLKESQEISLADDKFNIPVSANKSSLRTNSSSTAVSSNSTQDTNVSSKKTVTFSPTVEYIEPEPLNAPLPKQSRSMFRLIKLPREYKFIKLRAPAPIAKESSPQKYRFVDVLDSNLSPTQKLDMVLDGHQRLLQTQILDKVLDQDLDEKNILDEKALLAMDRAAWYQKCKNLLNQPKENTAQKNFEIGLDGNDSRAARILSAELRYEENRREFLTGKSIKEDDTLLRKEHELAEREKKVFASQRVKRELNAPPIPSEHSLSRFDTPTVRKSICKALEITMSPEERKIRQRMTKQKLGDQQNEIISGDELRLVQAGTLQGINDWTKVTGIPLFLPPSGTGPHGEVYIAQYAAFQREPVIVVANSVQLQGKSIFFGKICNIEVYGHQPGKIYLTDSRALLPEDRPQQKDKKEGQGRGKK